MQINWEKFEYRPSFERLTLEPNRDYLVGFSKLEYREINMQEGGNVKVLPALILKVRHLDGVDLQTEKELTITSKALIQQVRAYFEAGKIFNTIFRIRKTGSGFQTRYTMVPI